MTALWIILGIFAFLFLLLLCPITLTAGYETQLEAKLRFLFSATGWRRKKRKSPQRREKRKNRRKALPPSRSLSLSS